MRVKFSDTFKRKCKMDDDEVKFCCETCKSVNNVTAEVEITTTTQKPVTTEKSDTTQHLMYTRYESQTIYSYTLDVDQDPVKNGKYTIPFSTKFPGLVFNVQLNSLEIIGDDIDSSNKNLQMMTIAGFISEASGSLFDGDIYF